MNWLIKLFSKLSSNKHLTNINSGKSFPEMYDDLGVFQYDREGFTISYEDFTKRINWADITQLNAYKVDLFTTDRVDLEIVYGDKAFSISEELPGWYQFVIKTKEVFPTIPKDWDTEIIHPPFETNYTTIYERDCDMPQTKQLVN